MTDQSPAEVQPAEDNLSETIAAALKEQEEMPPESDSADAPDKESKSDVSEDNDTADDNADDVTDEDDAPADVGEDAEDSKEEEDDGDTDQAEDKDDTPAETPIDPPARLSEDHKTTFRSLPRDAQEFLRGRHQEMEADYTRKSQETAEARKTAEAFNTVAAPYQALFAGMGTTPLHAVQVLLAVDNQLRTGTADEKATMFAQLAQQYGVDVTGLPSSEDDSLSPEFTQMNQRLAGIERSITADRQQAANQVQSSVDVEISAFAEAKDEAGTLLHPHFETIKVTMGSLMETDGLSMQQAYDNAIWAKPELRKDVLAKQGQETVATAKRKRDDAEAKAKTERKVKAKAAKKAAAIVKADSGPVGTTAEQEMDLKAELTKNYEEAVSSP